MIKINLLGEEKTIDRNGLLILFGTCASLVVLLAAMYFVNASMVSKIDDLESHNAKLEEQLEEIKKKTKKVSELENTRQDLNNKLAIIAKLRKSKTGPVRVLDDLNSAIPERAWLSGVNEQGGMFIFEGNALDDHTIALFMKNLEASEYFEEIELTRARQVERGGIKIREFRITAKVDYAGELNAQSAEEEVRAQLRVH